MAIDPLQSPGRSDPGVRRPDQPARPAPSGSGRPGSDTDPDAAADSVELSAEALRLAAGGDIPSGTVTPERLADITRRLGDGSLDSDAAHDAIARGLSKEVQS